MQNQTSKSHTLAEGTFAEEEGAQSFKNHQKSQETTFIPSENHQKIIISDFMNKSQEKQGFNDSKQQSDDESEDDVLQEHKQVFQMVFKKNSSVFYTQRKNYGSNQNSQNYNQARIFKQITLDHFLSVLFDKLRQSRPALVKSFYSYLLSQKTFYRFLQHIYYSYPNQVVLRTLKYVFLIWELYLPCIKKQLSFNETISISKRISEKIFKNEIGQNHSKEFCQIKNNLRQTIEALALTVSLVMEKCSSNPLLCSNDSFDKQQSLSTSESAISDPQNQKISKRVAMIYNS